MTAILAAALASALWVGLRAKEKTEKSLEAPRSAELAMQMIRSDLEGAQPPGVELCGPFQGAVGQGGGPGNGSDYLLFYATVDAPQHQDGNGEVKQVQLLLDQVDNTGDWALVRRVTGNTLTQVQINPDEEVICRHVTLFTLRYWDGNEWQENWDSTQTQQNKALPAAVEVTLEVQPPRPTPTAPLPPILHLRQIVALSCVCEPSSSTSSSSSSSSSTTGGG